MTNSQKKTKALASTLRLLVMLREVLKAQGAAATPLFATVKAHADMCALALPMKMRLAGTELAAITRTAEVNVVDQSEEPFLHPRRPDGKEQHDKPIDPAGLVPITPMELPKAGEFIALTPEQLRKLA